MGRRSKTSGEDRSEGAADKVKGRLKEAAGCLEWSLAACRQGGLRHWEARALNSLGKLQAAKGNPTAACAAWRPALTILRELDLPEAAEVEAWLKDQG